MSRRTSPAGASIAFGLLVVLSGINLRAAITSVSATLGSTTEHYALDGLGVSLLSGLPVLLLASGAPFAPLLERRIGLNRAIVALAALLAASLALRPIGVVSLFIGTVVAGASISGLSVLTPQLVRARLPRNAGVWAGVFSTSFTLSATLGAGLTVPLEHAFGSVPLALAAWALPAAALAVYALVVGLRYPDPPAVAAKPAAAAAGAPGAASADAAAAPSARTRRPSGILLLVTVFFGTQAFAFFAIAAWLPTILHDRGFDPTTGANLLALQTFAGVPAALGTSFLASRRLRQHGIVVASTAVSLVALGGLAWGPTEIVALFVVLLGAAQGAAFSLGMVLIVIKAPDAASVARFSAFVQGFGFAFSALGPVSLGFAQSSGAPWSAAIAIVMGVVLVQSVAGWFAGRRVVL